VTKSESDVASVAATVAQQLQDTLEAIDSGNVTASAAQRAYLAGASHALKELAQALTDPAPGDPSREA
jgi:hypothetical protein